VRENLTIFPHGQYIAGNICSLTFRRNSQFETKVGVYVKFAKNVTMISRKSHAKQQRPAATYYAMLTLPWRR